MLPAIRRRLQLRVRGRPGRHAATASALGRGAGPGGSARPDGRGHRPGWLEYLVAPSRAHRGTGGARRVAVRRMRPAGGVRRRGPGARPAVRRRRHQRRPADGTPRRPPPAAHRHPAVRGARASPVPLAGADQPRRGPGAAAPGRLGHLAGAVATRLPGHHPRRRLRGRDPGTPPAARPGPAGARIAARYPRPRVPAVDRRGRRRRGGVRRGLEPRRRAQRLLETGRRTLRRQSPAPHRRRQRLRPAPHAATRRHPVPAADRRHLRAARPHRPHRPLAHVRAAVRAAPADTAAPGALQLLGGHVLRRAPRRPDRARQARPAARCGAVRRRRRLVHRPRRRRGRPR